MVLVNRASQRALENERTSSVLSCILLKLELLRTPQKYRALKLGDGQEWTIYAANSIMQN